MKEVVITPEEMEERNKELDNDIIYLIMKEARFARKGDYRTYESYKQRIIDLNLPWDKQDFILRELAKILRV